MAWTGNILRVDLTGQMCRSDHLRQEWAELYLGARGLGTKYLKEEMGANTDPFSPENVLIFATGPLTGTNSPTGGRFCVITKGALTNAIACSNSGGQFGGELKLAGWDMIIITGKAKTPVYLLIQDEKVHLHSASDFIWGNTVWETEKKLRSKHQDPLIRIASIGSAGENLVRYACIVNDKDRAAGRSGVGAVMGSKNLKAIAVRGTKGVSVRDPKAFLSAVAESRSLLDPSEGRLQLAMNGTMSMLDITQAHGSLPTRNCQDVQFEGANKINLAAMKRPRESDHGANLQANKACFACPIGCGRVSKIDPEHFSIQGKPQYQEALGGLEYEAGYALGPMTGVSDIEAATYVNAACNEHAMDPISFGATVAAAMELFENDAISLKETNGVALKFGSAKGLVWAVDVTGRFKGFGQELALGSKRLCEKFGYPQFAMVVKGQEFPGYDPRAMQGMGLAYATSNRGACHLRADPYSDDFDHLQTKGKAKIVKESQDGNSFIDSTGLCAFAFGDMGIDEVCSQLSAALPSSWDKQRAQDTGERIWNLERQFNLDAGFKKDDDTLPERVLKEPAKSGSGKGWVSQVPLMLKEYYQLRGWDSEGFPTKETLSRLGL
ncbi:MAG: putative oxidoreductase YdhV [Alphaproteobacteria bacterium MarineAlpha3_Bin5]|nr:aldehyde ferredoxin oxidoreductase [Magnetovibrio sp.]PPR77981.1 MAG: putative oxidoreductase YdhV [Alphaproteobacteria bacterium MarineAlpha3_Bin5]